MKSLIKFQALKSPITAQPNQLQFCLGIRATTLHISPKHQNSNLAEIQSPSTKAENKTNLPKKRKKLKQALFPVPTAIHIMVLRKKVDSVQKVEEKYLLFLLSHCAFFVSLFCLSPSFLTLSFIIYILFLCICAFFFVFVEKLGSGAASSNFDKIGSFEEEESIKGSKLLSICRVQ